MLVRNGTSRYDLVQQAIRAASQRNPWVSVRAAELVLHFEYLLREFTEEIQRTAEDPVSIRNWGWAPPER
jgi:hypothetical protein